MGDVEGSRLDAHVITNKKSKKWMAKKVLRVYV